MAIRCRATMHNMLKIKTKPFQRQVNYPLFLDGFVLCCAN